MQTDLSNVLNKLKPLSDNTDHCIYEHNREDVQINKWISIIKETANTIINDSPRQKSGSLQRSSCVSFEDVTLPNLVGLIKGKQNDNKHRISILLAGVQKDRVQHSNRKSRCSLRKIILGKKSRNKWEITNSRISSSKFSDKNSTPNNIKNTLSQSELKDPIETNSSIRKSSRKSLTESESKNQELNKSSYFTPIQCKEILAPNTSEATFASNTKKKNSIKNSKMGQKQISSVTEEDVEVFTPVIVQKQSSASTDIYATPSSQDIEIIAENTCPKNKADANYTPLNQTVIIDSVSTGEPLTSSKTPITRSKRKSSVQLTQENIKKSKTAESSKGRPKRRVKAVREDSNFGNQSEKRVQLSKNATTSVIQPKTSGGMMQQTAIQNEKRILREIQKKEDIVNQNTKKLRSLRQMKIEENKKAREMKMEKAMHQRMKIEKEKEQRIRCRTLSKQENVQQKKTAQKRVHHQDEVINSAKMMTPVSSKKKVISSSSSVKAQKEDRSHPTSSKIAPPKPARTPKKAKLSPNENSSSKETERPIEMNTTFSTNTLEKTLPTLNNDTFVKPSPINIGETSSLKSGVALTSTPAAKKVESKINISKTPISNALKKPTSYAMTPSESSFVSYDVSEIKSDDDDDEEEETARKPIPSWASGIRLRNALLNQHYNTHAADINYLFGSYFETPNLEKIMGVQKKHYFKRTSSAIWLNSPNRSVIS